MQSASIANHDDCNSSSLNIKINDHLHSYLSTFTNILICDASTNNVNINHDYNNASVESRMELDSHANMPVVGKHAYILSDTGCTADVKSYNPQYEAMVIPIVDAAIQYDCPYTGENYILVIRNALHVPSMDNHLIPPFIMREAGIEVNDTPKIHTDDPSVIDHCLQFKDNAFRIQLQLHGIFSYFPTTKPTLEMLQGCEEIYMLTSSIWNPHKTAYASNEESMLDWQCQLVNVNHMRRILLKTVDECSNISDAATLGHVETKAVKDLLGINLSNTLISFLHNKVPSEDNIVASVLTGINPLLDDATLCAKLNARNELGKFQIAVGSTHGSKGNVIMDNDITAATAESSDYSDNDDEIFIIDDIYIASQI